MSAILQTPRPIHSLQKNTGNISLDASWPDSRLWQVLILIGVAALYFGAAKLGLSFAYIHSHVSPIWPPTGVAIAAVLLFGYRVAPAILVGAFVANANGPVTFAAAATIAVGNTLEAVATRWLLQTVRFQLSFGRARDVFKFVTVALVCTTVSATIGTLSLCASASAPWSQFESLWVTWWLGDLAGAVTIAPLIIAWANRLGVPLLGWRLVETILLVLVVSLTAFFTYSERAPAALHYYPLTRLIVPVLLWASFRLGYRGLTLAIFLVTMFAAWGTVTDSGPFVSIWANESLVVLQLFISSNAVTFLFLTSVLEERRRAEEARHLDQQRVATNLAISRILAESPALDVAINRILKSIGEYLGWQIGAMWIPDRESNVLRCLTLWRRDTTTPSQFEIESCEREFSPGVGLPGRVWQHPKVVWVEDVVTDDNFPRAPFAAREGLHSAFAFPVLAGDKFLGVVEFFSAEIREPDESLLQMFQSVGSQMGQFMERRHAEESLRRRETELQLITENTPLMLTRCSRNLKYVFANRAYADMVGLAPNQIIGKPVVDIIGRDGLAAIQPYINRVLAGEQVEYEQEVRFKTVGSRLLHAVYRPDKDRSGAVVGWMASITDLTERRRAEEAQRRTENELNEVQRRTEKDLQLLASIVENTDDVIVGRDMEGLVTSWNAAAERLFGYQAEEMIGKPLSILTPPDRPHEEAEILGRLRAGEHIAHYETVRRAKDGRLIPVSLTTSPIRNISGVVIGFSKIARDISDQKKAEAERDALLKSEHAARAQAEEANRVKDEFLAVLSHELRTPLNAILGWANLLRSGKLDEQNAARALEIVERNATAQSKLIEGVLDVSRIVSGKLQLDIRPTQLSTVIAIAVDSIRPAADAKNMTLRVVGSEPEPLVLGDANRLQQVVWNLLSNAVKFSPAGGEVTVALRRSNSQVEIAVQDRGQGIPTEFLPHVFDRFRQADSSTTRKHGGLGLGLAIVRHLVELHGGTVSAESDGVGQGATFIVRLQAILKSDETLLATQTPKSPEIDPKSVLTGLKILVVDDHEDGREVLAEMLSMCDAEVKVAGSANEAISAIGEWRPQVIVSDISMPDVDGYEFIRQLRKLDGHRDIPAIAVTAHALAEDRERALAAGFQKHLAKPVQLAELAESIATITGRK
ncbi:MAG TPA: PAS domain S-box protein [Pyrinomonadaceae bacterium]|nr:PAS domain S-box protein [Pyrinomonadaceae bacterium]